MAGHFHDGSLDKSARKALHDRLEREHLGGQKYDALRKRGIVDRTTLWLGFAIVVVMGIVFIAMT